MTRKKPGITAATEYIEKLIAYRKDGEQLPTVRQLVKGSGLSTKTICTAINLLKQYNRINVKHGAGIYTGAKSITTTTEPEFPTSRVESLYRQITADLVSGRFEEDEYLPSYKELAYAYGVSYAILKKTLQKLVQENRIVPFNRRQKIVRYSGRLSNKTIVIMQGKFSNARLSNHVLSARYVTFRHHLEKQCAQRNIRLLVLDYEDRLKSRIDFSTVMGFLIWTNYGLDNIVTMVSHYKKPIIVFDDQLVFNAESMARNKNLFLFHLCDFRAGKTIGKHLLELGHTKICYLSLAATMKWDRIRYNGIVDAFISAGHTAESVIDLSQKIMEVSDECASGLPENLKQTFVTARMEENELHRIVSTTRSTKINPIDQGNIDWELNNYFDKIRARLGACVYVPQALAIKDVTAIVAHDDNYAGNGVLEVLKQMKIAVPNKLSVASFDNTFVSFNNNLTSYDFNMPAIVGRIMDVFMWPERHAVNAYKNIDNVEGFIAMRGSTGRPRK